jgi:hypothetical protein
MKLFDDFRSRCVDEEDACEKRVSTETKPPMLPGGDQ